MHYVYSFVDPRNNEVFYIGQGKGHRARQGPIGRPEVLMERMLDIVKQTNQAHTIEYIKKGLTKQEAVDLEIQMIAQYGRKDLGLGPLLNKTNGGVGTKGFIMPDEQRKDIRIRRTGTTQSEGTKEKISAAQPRDHLRKKYYEQPDITCPHCNKSGHPSFMHRWHFDNCKYRK